MKKLQLNWVTLAVVVVIAIGAALVVSYMTKETIETDSDGLMVVKKSIGNPFA